MRYFEDNDKELKKVHDDYKAGKLLSGELKQILIEKMTKFLEDHQKNIEKAKRVVDRYMEVK